MPKSLQKIWRYRGALRFWWKETYVYRIYDFLTDVIASRLVFISGATPLQKGFPYDSEVFYKGALDDPDLWFRVVVR